MIILKSNDFLKIIIQIIKISGRFWCGFLPILMIQMLHSHIIFNIFFLKKNKNIWLTHLPQYGNLNCWFPCSIHKNMKFSIFTLCRKLSHKAMNKLIKTSNYKMVLHYKTPETMTRFHRCLIITVIMLSLWPWTITVTLYYHWPWTVTCPWLFSSPKILYISKKV